jgi:hypothetical protein
MERYLGLDVHAASCTLAVISERGRKLRDFPVETNGQALVEAIDKPNETHPVSRLGSGMNVTPLPCSSDPHPSRMQRV